MIYFVEVIYLLRGQYDKRKYIQYPKIEDAEKIYEATIKKFKIEKQAALVCLRTDAGLVKSEKI